MKILNIFSQVLLYVSVCLAIPRELLYPHSPNTDLSLPRDQDDVASTEISLSVPILFYGTVYNSIYVNANGLLSFLTEIPSFVNIQFPLDYPVIAPLYTNVDTRGSGIVFYRETQEEALLERAKKTIQESFSNGKNFEPKSLFIVTWKDVGYHERGADKVNTYQVVIANNGTDSYALFLYTDGGIQWIQGEARITGLPDARAQAGFVSGDGRLYTLRGSGTDQTFNLDKWSNAGVPGLWVFHIGDTGYTGNILPPDLQVSSGGPESIETCIEGSSVCHSKARCIDYTDLGYCCSCHRGYYGNGLNCLKEGIPLRVIGKVNGILNGENVTQLDLQSYVVTVDGRTYTAISKVPNSFGYDMQVLSVLGGVIGWLFSRPLHGALNGYQITGGVFNHTADILFPLSGNKVTIRQHYYGLDVFDQLKMEAEILGNLPTVPTGTKIQIPDYEEQFTRTEPGLILAKSSLIFHLDGQAVDNPFTVEQTIQYTECKYAPLNITTLNLKVARNFISYEGRESIVRYAMTNKVSPPGDFDPCREGKSHCGEHSSCRVEGDSYRCICNPGFQPLYDEAGNENGAVCIDINECSTGTHNCDVNALCINEEGSFFCQCGVGYSGDGRTCKKQLTCEDLGCHPDAECIETNPGQPQCICLKGYVGNGLQCTLQKKGCEVARDCSPFGTCVYSQDTGSYQCICLPGYYGDGYLCVEHVTFNDTSPVPTCLQDLCWCPPGYDLQGQTCIRTEYEEATDGQTGIESRPEAVCYNATLCFCPSGYVYSDVSGLCNLPVGADIHSHGTKGQSGNTISCNVVNNCHPHAHCVYSTQIGRHKCQCSSGYEGDGYECSEIDVSCFEVDMCDIHATCTYDERTERPVCKCSPGYQGDGIFCSLEGECATSEDCGSHGLCVPSPDQISYRCSCERGYIREGPVCIPEQEEGCDITQNCDVNAQCVYDPELEEHRCVCFVGYTGDGQTCSPDHISCNIVNNCDREADCVYDSQAAGYRCRCKQGFQGDGFVCTPKYSCLQNPNLCGADASCIHGPLGHYVCACNEGFVGDGVHCKALSQHEGNFLLLSQGMATLRIPVKPSATDRPRPIVIQYFQMAVGIDIDCLEGRVYWSDVAGEVIRSANYDGSNVTTFLSTANGSPEGLSIDWVSRNLYWTDSKKDTLEVANLNTGLQKVLISKGLVNPRGIAVHPSRGKVFWSDWNRESPKIEWANEDGSGRSIFFDGPTVKLPNSLAIDFERDELCWADAGTKSIDCIGIGTHIHRTIASNCSYPFGLAISNEYYYWSDWHTKKIERAERITGKRSTALTVPLGGSGKLYGIVAVPEICPRQSSICQHENGYCKSGEICLLNGKGGRSCICADNAETGSGDDPICT